ncbi:MAG: 1-deoxy-D-xylulose-5-phosphate synthase, partial [FCB group bacterium]|nr:1-deoxy-D-xylulose-5-phosphate synthase [FCB group bacterium]
MFDYKLLSHIDGPDDLKKLTVAELAELSDELTHMIRTTVEDVGGHYATPLGVVDLTIALHYIYNSPIDKLIWDVGHQAYAHKILTGRRDRFSTLRQKDGLSGYLRRTESPHDVIGAGHASTAISSALGIAHARDMKGTDEKVVAIVGDGAMTGGLSWEGLNNLGYHRTQLVIVLNDNSMSISPSVGALSKYLTKITTHPTYNKMRDDIWHVTGRIPGKLSQFTRRMLRKTEEGIKGILTPGVLFEELGLRYIGPVDGHSMEDLVRTFKAVRSMPNPTLVHVYTHKGKGSELAEAEPSKYYSLPGKKISKKQKPAPDYSKVFGSVAAQLAEKNDKIICITAAMGIGTGMSEFSEKFPGRYKDVGIAEEHAVTYASGLATDGFRPIVALYSTFMQRAWDNIFHDVLLQNLPVMFCLDRSGVVGSDGPTHHGVFDIALLRQLPGMIVTAPRNGDELRDLVATALSLDKAFSIRYPKATSEKFTPGQEPEILPIGSWEVLNKGEEIALLATGSMVGIGLNAMDDLTKELGFAPTLVNARFIKPMDEELLTDLSRDHRYLLTVEEGILAGGFGSGVLEFINDRKL